MDIDRKQLSILENLTTLSKIIECVFLLFVQYQAKNMLIGKEIARKTIKDLKKLIKRLTKKIEVMK